MIRHSRQSGISLVVGMIILLLLTLITLTAMRVTSLEEKMAGNLYNQNIAFQAAESALREAEALIRDGETANPHVEPPFKPLKLSAAPFGHAGETACVQGMCALTDPKQSEIFPGVSGATRTASTGIANIWAEPEYIIELVRVEPSTDSSRLFATFLITTRAWGRDANSVVQLQSSYRLHVRSFVL